MFNESVTTIKGMRLNAKIQAGRCLMQFTRMKLGNGSHEPDEQLENVTELISTKQEALISDVVVHGENCIKVNAIITNEGVTEGFYIHEVGIFAEDPDAGEILYAIATGVIGKMDYHPSAKEMVDYSLSLDMYLTISNADKIKIETLAGAVASAEDLKKTKIEVEQLKNPEFDDSGSVAGIASFPDFLAKVKSKMNVFKFFEDFVAGAKFILHTGQIVNNCVSDRADLPLAAKQGKELMDLLTKLNSDLNPIKDTVKNGNVVTTIRNLVSVNQKKGILLFTGDSTGLPDNNKAGIVKYVAPDGTEVIYLEFLLERHHYYGYILGNATLPTWDKYVTNFDIGHIRIDTDKGDTFKNALNGRYNCTTYLAFAGDPTDNPFSFPNGFAIAFHNGLLYDTTRFALIGINYTCTTMETHLFDIK